MLGVEVGALVREMVVRGFLDVRRITYGGPTVVLDARAAVQLGLVLHELTANAHKHGALAVSQGMVSITWVVRHAPARSLDLMWRESGVEGLRPPQGEGFGRALIDGLLKSISGAAVFQFVADGLVCQIAMPLPSNAEQPHGQAMPGDVADSLAALATWTREPS